MSVESRKREDPILPVVLSLTPSLAIWAKTDPHVILYREGGRGLRSAMEADLNYLLHGFI